MKPTPITEALERDPAIERRDVPNRVWRVMERLESDRARLIERLRVILADNGLSSDNAIPARALLAELEREVAK